MYDIIIEFKWNGKLKKVSYEFLSEFHDVCYTKLMNMIVSISTFWLLNILWEGGSSYQFKFYSYSFALLVFNLIFSIKFKIEKFFHIKNKSVQTTLITIFINFSNKFILKRIRKRKTVDGEKLRKGWEIFSLQCKQIFFSNTLEWYYFPVW
jgi:hypothetical protein